MRVVTNLGTACLLTLVLTPTTPAWSQSVRGTVLDDEWSVPIETARVVLLATDDSIVGQSTTDEDGRFVIELPEAGSYRLRAPRIGYASTTSNAFALTSGQGAELELRLQPSPILPDTLAAIVEGQSLSLARAGFYRREAIGFGHFLTPEELATKPGLIDLEDVFTSMRGIEIRGGTDSWDVFSTRAERIRPCRLSVSINGQVVQVGGRGKLGTFWTDSVHILNVATIEVYLSAAGLPIWMAGSISECGAVVIWTKGYVR